MKTQISEKLDSNNSVDHKKTPKSEQVWKWITTATAAILLSACAAPQRNPNVVVIHDAQYNSSLSVYERERVLSDALDTARRERELLNERRRLEEQRMRNRQKEYSDQVRLQQKTRQFEAEQGRKIIEPTTQVPNTPPAPRKPVSIYPDK